MLLTNMALKVHLRRAALALAFCLGSAAGAHADVDYGELRLHVTDASGARVVAKVELVDAALGYDKTFTTTARGSLAVTHLPFGIYKLNVSATGFATSATEISLHSAVPVREKVTLGVERVTTHVEVTAAEGILDPGEVSSSERIGTRELDERTASLPGRSVQDLVASQPGWVYEGSAVLHPRGSEYQTQFVVDGIPYTDNRSPGLGPEIEADDLESISEETAGYSAEYGRKLGGVVELNTRRPENPGVHGRLVLDGGTYATAAGFGDLEAVEGANSFGVSASGSTTDHYLNPVVPENYTNHGTTGDFSGRFARDFSGADRLTVGIRHDNANFEVPNELPQQAAGQLQKRDTVETAGTANYQHIASADALLSVSGMVRDNANDLSSNADSTPIAATLNDSFREVYFKAAYTLHRGRHEFKAGAESDDYFLHEKFGYAITDPDYFDEDTPPSLAFAAQRPDLEEGAWLEDTVRLGAWTVRAGLRWDHYQLVVNDSAFSPRLSLSRYLRRSGTVLHASFDRIFQTPAFENILLSSSDQVRALSPEFLRLPVKPSRANFYEGGATQAIGGRIRVDANVYRRDARDFADDDQLLNTSVSYPIAFNKAVIYGAEGKLSLVRLGGLSGFVSYSYMVGAVWFPVTGGLFLGDDASDAVAQTSGHFPNSQDQRNTLSTRFQYRLTKRAWVALGELYGSGLPFEYSGSEDAAAAEYGAAVVSKVNFERGRIRPQSSVNGSLGIDLFSRDDRTVSLQVDGENLEDRLNVIDFGGLFSGNAIGPERMVMARLRVGF